MTRVVTIRQRSFVLGVLAIALTYASIVGILQNYYGVDLRLLLKPPGYTEVRAVGIAASDPNTGVMLRSAARRSLATMQHPIEFSLLAAVAVVLSLHFARFGINRSTRQLASAATFLAIGGLVSASSRTGIVALTVMLLVYLATLPLRQLANTIAIGSGVVLLGSRLIPGGFESLWTAITLGTSGEDTSVQGRLNDYDLVARIFRDHPLLGTGIGPAPAGGDGALDNQWLYAVVQGGLVGFAALLILALGGVAGFRRAFRASSSPREKDQTLALGACFIGCISATFTFDYFTYIQASITLSLIYGLLWSTGPARTDGETF